MDLTSILKHLITEEVCFPVLKLVWDKRIEAEDFGELPKITPTHYIKENLLTTEDRHRILCRQQRKIPARRAGAEVIVEPPIIVFQNYKFGETYSFPIVVRNVSRNSQKVAILMDESYGFKFDKCSQRIAKFPCGMCITASVIFTPENPLEDYYHKLVVSTNTTKVVVPIIGVGPRPLLNAPDSVIFSDSPVRYWSVKTVNVLNVGKKTAKFTLSATGSFCVKPDKGVALPNQAFTFEVAYYSSTVATHEGEIRVRYDNGEEIYIYLRGNAVNCDIKLSSSDIRCEDTFMTLQTRATFWIENNSSITAKYYWKTQSEYDDMLRFYGRCDECPHQWKDGEGLQEALQRGEERTISYSLLPECEETLNDVKKKPDSLFSSENFQLYPSFGEIKPNSKVEVQVIFTPTQCSFYEGVAYLDISGLENRLPFTFYGRGIGPKFKLAFDVLNVETVALGGAHTYEIPVQNISEIPGTIKCEGLVGLPSGMDMRVDPASLYVDPDQYVAFYVSLTLTGKPGPFEDELKFVAPESGDTFYVTVLGEVALPGIRFGSNEAHMGTLSIGFPKSFSIPLVNDSLNYVNVEIKMEQDGIDSPIDFNAIIKSFKNEKWKLEGKPAEFKVVPNKFTLKPHGAQRIEVTFSPCAIREIKNKLECFITDVDQQGADSVASINIRGSVIAPALQVIQGALQMKECFLHFPYPAEFIVKNTAEVPVIYYITHKPFHNIEINSTSFMGVAEPWVETVIPFEVTSVVGGETSAHLDLHIVGVDEKVDTLSLKLDAIPSKVEASTKMVDFGKLEVLDEKVLSVDVINTSPITFPFTAQLIQEESLNRGEIWQIEPETGILPSQSKITLAVTVILKEVGWHYAAVKIQMNEPIKHVIEVKMKGLGVGSPLVATPRLSRQNTLDFGTIFIKQDKILTYEIENHGVNPRAIDWKHHGDKPPVNRNEESKPTFRNLKRNMKHAPDPPPPPTSSTQIGTEKESLLREKDSKKKSNFVIHPMHAIIPPGGTLRVSIAAHSSLPKTAEEVWNLWTYVPVTKQEQSETGPGAGRRGSRPSVQSKGSVVGVGHGGHGGVGRGGGIHKFVSGVGAGGAGGFGRGAGKGPPASEPQNLHLRPMIQTELKLNAVFEVPGLRFSKRSIDFVIEATPTQENFVVDDVLRLENVGSLPLKITLKTKFPFTFRSRHDEHYFEEGTYEVDVKKSLAFKVRFDGQHLRKELGKVTYEERLDATCEGFQGVESIDLCGVVKFPELSVDRTVIDFGVITNGMEGVEQITVENTGPFCLTYKWYIKPGSTSIQRNPDAAWSTEVYWEQYRPSINSDNHLKVLRHHHHHHHHHHNKVGPNQGTKAVDPRRKSLKDDAKKIKETPYSPLLGFRTDIGSNYEDFAAFIKEKMYRSRLMEFMGLKDAEYEAEDEVNYLAYYNQNASLPKEEFYTNELIDVIPLAGVVQAGQTQSFTVVFYGYPDITFRATLILFVEGGARKNIEIRAKTVPPRATPDEAAILARVESSKSSVSASIGSSYGDEAVSNRSGATDKTF